MTEGWPVHTSGGVRSAYFIVLFALLSLASCDTMVLEALENICITKRDVLIDRIESAQEAQEDGHEQFKSALEEFKTVLAFDGGDLEAAYSSLNGEYEDSVSAAEEISDRIDSVESVAEALFNEWQTELAEYTSASLRRDSERQLRATRNRYNRLMTSMRSAEQSIEPVLASLKDNVLYLKHNLNARAIASLRGELANVDGDVTRLLEAMNAAIEESNAFIAELRSNGA